MTYPWEDPEWGTLPDTDRVLIFNEYMKEDREWNTLLPEDRKIIREKLGAGAIEPAAAPSLGEKLAPIGEGLKTTGQQIAGSLIGGAEDLASNVVRAAAGYAGGPAMLMTGGGGTGAALQGIRSAAEAVKKPIGATEIPPATWEEFKQAPVSTAARFAGKMGVESLPYMALPLGKALQGVGRVARAGVEAGTFGGLSALGPLEAGDVKGALEAGAGTAAGVVGLHVAGAGARGVGRGLRDLYQRWTDKGLPPQEALRRAVKAEEPTPEAALADLKSVAPPVERRQPDAAYLRQIFDQMPEDRRLGGVQDAVTGVANRNALDYHVEQNPAWHNVMFDMKGFKDVNDAYGHKAGDEVLKYVSGIMREEGGTPEATFLARYGGDEFVARSGGMDTALDLASRVSKRLENHTLMALDESGNRVDITLKGVRYGEGPDLDTARASLKAEHDRTGSARAGVVGRGAEPIAAAPPEVAGVPGAGRNVAVPETVAPIPPAQPVGTTPEVPTRRPPELGEYYPPITEPPKPAPREAGAAPELGEYYPPLEPKPGPGTKVAGTREVTGDITQLARSLEPPVQPTAKRGPGAAFQFQVTKERAQSAVQTIKAISDGLWEAYMRPPVGTQAELAARKWQGSLQRLSFETTRFARSVKRAHPDKLRREAMSIFAEANGDAAKIKEWADKSTGPAKAKYEAALTLNENEQVFARNARNYWDAKLDKAIEAGLLEQGVEDYVMHLVGRQNKTINRLRGDIDLGKLTTNPSFIKQRIHDTIFEVEQAGHTIESDLGALISAYEQSFGKALANRTYIRSLTEAKASDGRPVAVPSPHSGVIIGEEKPAVLIKERVPPEKLGDYRVVNHPALRGWTWAGKDPQGNPIFYKGDLLIHPEAYAKLRNRLATSWFRTAALRLGDVEIKPFVGAMKIGATVKGTMLDLSGFHQVQVSVHGLEHRVNPARLTNIDLDSPKQMALVEGGLQLADYRAMQEFSEGSTSGSLVRKIPVLGTIAQRYNEYLFHDFIPRMKMTMALHALERNRTRYPKMSEPDLNALTARQSNAAFGEQNYRLMGRNPTFQDLLRLTLLAPDFLEARGRFVAQALRPYGKEQAAALMLGAVSLYAMARLGNYILNDDHDTHPSKPFSLVVGGKEYRLRTVQGDLMHLISSPRQFGWVRLNPALMKPGIEMLTGRDEFGKPLRPGERILDVGKQSVPIVFQKKLRSPDDYTILDSILQTLGITNVTYRTKAEEKANKIAQGKATIAEVSPEAKARSRARRRIFGQIEKGEKPEIPSETFTPRQVTELLRDAGKPRLLRTVQTFSIDEARSVWERASPKERTLLRIPFFQKVQNKLKSGVASEEELRRALEFQNLLTTQ